MQDKVSPKKTSNMGSKVASRAVSPIKAKEEQQNNEQENHLEFFQRAPPIGALCSTVLNHLVSLKEAPAKYLRGSVDNPILLEQCCRSGRCK